MTIATTNPHPNLPARSEADPRLHALLPSAQREREYSPSSCIGGDYQPFVAAYAECSRQAVAQLGAAWQFGLAYGDAPTQRQDLMCPARAPGAPLPALLVFIHGGYWQELSRVESRFAAPDCAAAGLAFAALDYTLAPAAGVLDMALECRSALRWLVLHAPHLGFDAQRIVLAGSSAGAHLAALCALRGWAHDADLPAGVPAATVLVSGVYELAPLLGTSINAALGLDAESVAPISPLRHEKTGFRQSLIAWGAIETEAFKQQSRAFAAQLQAAGNPVQTLELAERNHFDVILDLARSGSPLGDATLALCAAPARG